MSCSSRDDARSNRGLVRPRDVWEKRGRAFQANPVHGDDSGNREHEARGLVLSAEQRDALAHVTQERDLGIVIGTAGAGKSAMLGVAREAWEAAGYEVRGAALSGIAAENLAAGSGIEARTIASLEHGWAKGADLLTTRDVLVVDEAGMVGTRTMESLVAHAAEVGAKLVLVGDRRRAAPTHDHRSPDRSVARRNRPLNAFGTMPPRSVTG